MDTGVSYNLLLFSSFHEPSCQDVISVLLWCKDSTRAACQGLFFLVFSYEDSSGKEKMEQPIFSEVSALQFSTNKLVPFFGLLQLLPCNNVSRFWYFLLLRPSNDGWRQINDTLWTYMSQQSGLQGNMCMVLLKELVWTASGACRG